MRVSRVEACGKNKSKVFLEEGFAFVLYRAEVSDWGIAEGEELPEEIYGRILREILLPRAKEKALSLLEVQSRTCRQLRDRLAREGYPREAVEEVMDFLAEYHLTDDGAYARSYVAANKGKKSAKQMEWELVQRGVEREEASRALSEEGHDEEQAVRRYLERKLGGRKPALLQEKSRIWAALGRKGFSPDVIKAVRGEMEEESLSDSESDDPFGRGKD